MNTVREILSFIRDNKLLSFSALFFLTASHICTVAFPLDPEQNREWWWLRAVFYSFQNYLGYYVAMKMSDKLRIPSTGAFCCVMAGIALSDAIDKLGKEYNYTWWDVPIIIITIIYTAKKYAKISLVHPSSQG